MWRQQRLAEERRDDEYKEMLERDLEEEAREAEEEARQAAAQPPALALPPPEQLPPDYVAAAWATAFPWAGPPPTLIGLTDPEDDDDDDA